MPDPLEGALGIRSLVDGTGDPDVVLPLRGTLRLVGGGLVVTTTKDATEIEFEGDIGPKGPNGDRGPTGDTGNAGTNGTNGTNGATGATGPTGTLATIGRLDNTYSPVAIWHFDGALTDSSGNSHDLSVDVGTAVYAELWPGHKGLDFAGALRLIQSSAAFQIPGNITIEFVCVLNAAPNGNPIMADQAAGETSGTNTQYQLSFGAATRLFSFVSEHGAGVDDTYALTAAALPPPGVPFHFCLTRTSNVLQAYVNGVAHGPASSALTAPDGGGSAVFTFGGGVSTLAGAMLCSELKVISSALNSTQVAAEAELTIGQLY